jgi:aryl carrier-like protein
LGRQIEKFNVNMGLLTPSVARLLDSAALRRFKVLLLGGEPVSEADYYRISRDANIIDAYGPTETTVVCTLGLCTQEMNRPPSHLGKAVGACCWVVQPNNHRALAPFGAVGELLVEGPGLSRGYLNDLEKTGAAFVKSPPWLVSGSPDAPGRRGRLYKTGDLVKYNADGSLSFVGRKDTQVKLHGQRVELGEVEHHVREAVPEAQTAKHVAAEVILPPGEDTNGKIVVFLAFEDATMPNEPAILELPSAVAGHLSTRLPAYMLPAAYVALSGIPMSTAGKLDRNRLREIGAPFLAQRLADLRDAASTTKRLPSTDKEKQLQQLWSRVLKMDPLAIGLDDDFFQLGGDSIHAMKLLVEARHSQLKLTMADIFRQPSLANMAVVARRENLVPEVATVPDPFTLVAPDIAQAFLARRPEDIPCPDPGNIADILPTVGFQEHSLRLCDSSPHLALNYFSLRLGANVDFGRFKTACRHLLNAHSILRSVFVPYNGSYWQLVLRQLDPPLRIVDIEGDVAKAIHENFIQDTQLPLLPGSPFTAFTLFRHKVSGYHLMIRLSHAQYDGVCLPLILQTFFDAYDEKPLASETPFSAYLAHVNRHRDSSQRYWRQLLQGAQESAVQSILRPADGQESTPMPVEAESSILIPTLPAGITIAALVSSAWAHVVSAIVGRTDVVYGQVVTGRNGAMPRIQEVIGPCVNIIPVRIRIDRSHSPHELLTAVQDQILSLGSADAIGLDEIVRNCTDWAPGTQLDSVVEHFGAVNLPKVDAMDGSVQLEHLKHPEAATSHVGVFSTAEDGQLTLKVTGSSHFLTSDTARKLVDMLQTAVVALSRSSSQPVLEW